MVTRFVVLAVLPLIAACAAAPAKQACPPPDNRAECATFAQIDVSCADVLTDSTAKQIVAHNKAGKAACGWKPRPCR